MGTQGTPESTVRQFCDAFGKGDAEALRPFFTDDVVYHNIPMEPAVGVDAAVAVLAGFFAMADRVEIRITHLATAGDVVLTERIDEFTVGSTVAPLPVMGTFELSGGRIRAWRDYFDLAQVTAMFSGEGGPSS